MSKSKKRPLSKSYIESKSDPPTKRRRLNNESAFLASSKLFQNEMDKKQYAQLFNSIHNSDLIKILGVDQDTIQNISEFATGNWVICANEKCNISISILHQDLKIRNNDKKAHVIGYKYCNVTNKYFCQICMNETVMNDCSYNCTHQLVYKSLQCDECKNLLCNFCDYDLEERFKCITCNGIRCIHCYGINCVICDAFSCDDCRFYYEEFEEGVCKKCKANCKEKDILKCLKKKYDETPKLATISARKW